jgi:hypothetical protein
MGSINFYHKQTNKVSDASARSYLFDVGEVVCSRFALAQGPPPPPKSSADLSAEVLRKSSVRNDGYVPNPQRNRPKFCGELQP